MAGVPIKNDPDSSLVTNILQTAIDKIGKAVGDYLAALQLFFNNLRDSVTAGVNASTVLKEGGRIDSVSEFDIQRRLTEESKPFYISIVQSNQTFGGAVLNKDISGGGVVYPGHCFIPKHSTMKTSRSLQMFLNIGSNSPSGYNPYRLYALDGIDTSLSFNKIIEGSSIGLVVTRSSASDGDAAFNVVGSVEGDIIGKFYNKKTDYIFLMEGDSISEYAAFTSGSDDLLFGGILREYFCTPATILSKGKTVRPVNKAKGSTTSTHLIGAMRAGELDITERVSLRTCMIGTNDIVLAYNADNTLANLPTIISNYIANITIRIEQHIKRYGSAAPFFIIAPPPLYNTVQESALVQLRNALKVYINSIGGGIWNGGSSAIVKPTNNIWFASFGATNEQAGLWVANSYNFYIEKTGNAIHPDAVSNVIMGNWLTNMCSVNNIKLISNI